MTRALMRMPPVLLALLSFASQTSGQEPRTSALPSAGAIESGKVLFNSIGCWACHGFSGQGANTGPKIAPLVLPAEAFRHLLRNPINLMPAYGIAVLTDAQVADLDAYLRSLPATPGAKDIPLLMK